MTPPASRALALRAEQVSKGFRHGLLRRRRVEVLRGASLQVRQGELVGLVGENGSGKSVLMKIIVGLLGRDGGDVQLEGRLGYELLLAIGWALVACAAVTAVLGKALGLSGQAAAR